MGFNSGFKGLILLLLRQRHRLFGVKYMNMVIYGDLKGSGEKGVMVYFDVLFPNSRTGSKKTASNRMADVLWKTRRLYLPLFSSCRLNQLFVTTRTCRISAVRCWFLGAKNRVPSVDSVRLALNEMATNRFCSMNVDCRCHFHFANAPCSSAIKFRVLTLTLR